MVYSLSFDFASGGGANAWDYISNGASIVSADPTIRGTWIYITSGGNVRWTGKRGYIIYFQK